MKGILSKDCAWCGRPFSPKVAKSRFCSFKCSGHSIAREKHKELLCLTCHWAVGMSLQQSADAARKSRGGISQYRKRHGLKGMSIKRAQKAKADEAARMRNALERAWKLEWINAKAEDCAHWWEHPIFVKWKAVQSYYRNHEANRAAGREKAKRTWKQRKGDEAWREKRREHARQYRANNKEKWAAINKRWKTNNPDKWKEVKRKMRERQKADPAWRAMRNLRKRLREVLKGKRSARSTVGCSKDEFMRRIESKFKRGMQWNNYGTHWHIDHIVPITSFDLSDPYQAKMANHWTNLQPLEAEKNIEKSNSIQGNVQTFLPIWG